MFNYNFHIAESELLPKECTPIPKIKMKTKQEPLDRKVGNPNKYLAYFYGQKRA